MVARRLSFIVAASVTMALLASAATGGAQGLPAVSVESWGSDHVGELGDGVFGPGSALPVLVDGLGEVMGVEAGEYKTSLALLDDGTVMAWGAGSKGEFGNGTLEAARDVPEPVGGLSGVEAISAGAYHILALMRDGTVMAWGNNVSGQLGNGTSTGPSICGGKPCSTVPVQVLGLGDVAAIAAGGNHSLALLDDDEVMAWGNNEFGQLGDGTTTNRDVPVSVAGLSGVVAITAGAQFSIALLENGEVMTWGWNHDDQLGNGTNRFAMSHSDVPVPVGGLSEVTAISAGGGHAMALLAGGTVVGWGNNERGQLGDGTTVNKEIPTPVGGLGGVTAISAGYHDSLALLSDGRLAAWGENRYGQLGNGTTTGSAVPELVPGLGGVGGVSSGPYDSIAFGPPLPTVTGVSPDDGSPAGGEPVLIVGENLGNVTAMHFGQSRATSFALDSATSLIAVPPPGTGTVNVTVTTPAGTSPLAPGDQYSYGAPNVIKVSPRTGTAVGGTAVTVIGSGFGHASRVQFGSTEATGFTVESATVITAVAPSEIAGPVDVTVTTPAGVSPITAADRFKFVPAVSNVSPSSGPAAGGTSVTITGAGFAVSPVVTKFRFGKSRAVVGECESTTRCTVFSPAGEAGAVDVKALVSGAVSPRDAPADRFTFY